MLPARRRPPVLNSAGPELVGKCDLTQFIDRLRQEKRTQFVSLRAVCDPRMRKRDNPWAGRIRKVIYASGVINFVYGRLVNRQRRREQRAPTFAAAPRRWGRKLKGCPLIEHTNLAGETWLYLDIKLQSRVDQYRDCETGAVIPRDELLRWLPDYYRPKHQGVSREIVVRDFRLDHIAELRLGGERWTIEPAATELQKLLLPKRQQRSASRRAPANRPTTNKARRK